MPPTRGADAVVIGSRRLYVAQFYVPSGPRLAEPLRYEIADALGSRLDLLIEPRFVRDPFGTAAQLGLYIDVSFNSEGVERFAVEAQAIADLLVAQMSLVQPRWSSQGELRFAYAASGPNPREVILMSDAWETRPGGSAVDPARLTEFIQAYFALPEERQWRLGHAIEQFRTALAADGPADRVPVSFGGLEFLNPLLEGLGFRGPGQSSGVSGYLKSHGSEAFELRARRARNDLVHGNKPIADMEAELTDVEMPLLGALRSAAYEIAGLAPERWDPGRDELVSPAHTGNTLAQFFGRLDANAEGDVAPPGHRHPTMEVVWRVAGSAPNSTGTYLVDATPVVHAALAAGASLRVMDLNPPTGIREVEVVTKPLPSEDLQN